MNNPQSTMPALKDFRPFLPSCKAGRDVSIQFYQDLGFKLLWSGPEVSEFDTGSGQRFILSNNYNKALAENMMLQLWVESVDDWYAYIKPMQLDKKYPGVKVAEPEVQPWGWRILYIWDPAGVLLHIGEPHTKENKDFFDKADWMACHNE